MHCLPIKYFGVDLSASLLDIRNEHEVLLLSAGDARMRQALSIALFLCLTFLPRVGRTQTTISQRPLDITVGNGLWGVFLPEYELGLDSVDGIALFNDGQFFGYQGDFKINRRFLHTRTNVEARAFYGFSESSKSNLVDSLSLEDFGEVPQSPFENGSASLASGLDHYGYDLGLRDTWKTRWGGLSAGCLFSYMVFDQDYEASFNNEQFLREELDSKFIGGKAVFGWDGFLHESPAFFDLALGFYQLRADYSGEMTRTGDRDESYRYTNPMTIDANFTLHHEVRKVRLSSTVGITHLGEMPLISRAGGEFATIEFEDGLLIKLMFEVLL